MIRRFAELCCVAAILDMAAAGWSIAEPRRVAPALLMAEPDLVTVSLTLKLRTGGQLTGAVLDHDEHAIVILSDNVPYVFAWSELDASAALGAKRVLLAKERGGAEYFSADDHFQLGMFVLRNGRNDLASNEFDQAKRLDRGLTPRIQEAYSQFRRETDSMRTDQRSIFNAKDEPATRDNPDNSFLVRMEVSGFDQLPAPSEQVRADVREAYLRFGQKVREVMGMDIRLVESEHFLIWTDWGPREQMSLTQWCESTYDALCLRFGIESRDDIFLAKCPVFCFRSKARFRKFARDFDGYDAKYAIGYTRSIEENGHVHMVFARMGATPPDYDRFACTLVHEGTHAFLHRVNGTRLLPHWVNEGYAELTAERILGDRCPAGGNAALLARQYARFDWPVTPFMNRLSTIEVHEYPLAHSLVAYLDRQDPQHFASFIRDLKKGSDLTQALASNFDGLTFEALEKNWKQSVRDALRTDKKND